MLDQAAQIRSYFDATAEHYAREREHEFSFSTQRCIALELLPGRIERVLDIGCGPAVMADALLSRADEFWGIDLSAQMIAHGRARMANHPHGHRCHLAVADAEATSFTDGLFDAIVSLGMLEYLLSYERALAEIFRLLRPGGVAVLATPNRISAYHRSRRASDAIRHVAKRLLGRAARPSENFVTNRCVPAKLDQALERAGFKKVEGRYCNFIFHPLHELHPGASMALNRRISALSRPPFASFLGSQYVVKVMKPHAS
ncbi:MAG TPA: class I SAM-dependent methyltransferase [Burkholderiales bacterium]